MTRPDAVQGRDEPFSVYRARAEAIARPIFEARARGALDEQALPAYLEGFRASRWLFWNRLKIVYDMIAPMCGETALDFGCGAGIVIPALTRRFDRVVGVDIMPDLAPEFLSMWDVDTGEAAASAPVYRSLEGGRIESGSLDLIIALDVLEHLEDIDATLAFFDDLLKPEGRLIVSGPTESWLYRIGRRLVGFSGDYHTSNIYDIKRQMEGRFAVRVARRLYPPLPLFLILTAAKR